MKRIYLDDVNEAWGHKWNIAKMWKLHLNKNAWDLSSVFNLDMCRIHIIHARNMKYPVAPVGACAFTSLLLDSRFNHNSIYFTFIQNCIRELFQCHKLSADKKELVQLPLTIIKSTNNSSSDIFHFIRSKETIFLWEENRVCQWTSPFVLFWYLILYGFFFRFQSSMHDGVIETNKSKNRFFE